MTPRKVQQLAGYAEIARLAGVSRQRARELADLSGFPPVVAQSRSAGPLRDLAAVEAWVETWKATRKTGRPRKVIAGAASPS